MNEFTKEELQIILLDMNAYIHRTTILAESPSHRNLRDKVMSMIDNYYEPECKHESDGNTYCSNPPQNKCKLCGKFYR